MRIGGAATAGDRGNVSLFSVGEVVGETFEVRGLLGRGAMGQVYEADDRLLRRRVALKVMPRVGANADGSVLRREAQALAAVKHPCLMTIHGLGAHRGIEFLILERLYGMSLEDHLASVRNGAHPIPVPEALAILGSLADGLIAVHAAGMAHRDIKPSNVMLCPGGRVVLVDFGVFLPEVDAPAQKYVFGTPHYMAPEVIANKIEAGKARIADVYSFGAVAFELLAGAPPFDATTIVELLSDHLWTDPPDVVELRPDAPPELAALVRECLRKAPGDRPSSMEEISARLRRERRRERPTGSESSTPILIVDDDPDAAELMRACVFALSPRAPVRIVPDGERALDAVRQQAPRVIVVDLRLPGMSGLELCLYLRGTRLIDRCEIVAVSAEADPGTATLLEQIGVRRLLPKGGDFVRRLSSTMREILLDEPDAEASVR